MTLRPYTFIELTNSLCPQCLEKVEAKVIEQEGQVYLLKFCPEHGHQKVLIANDAEYYKFSRSVVRPGNVPKKFGTSVKHGCPYDCGLCTDHEQHSCVTLIEVTDRCNLTCPVCYAESSPTHLAHKSLEDIERMLGAVVEAEGEPDVVQISGGEPTIHPQFFEILAAAKKRPIKHLMLNTNGVRIAASDDFCKQLSEYMPGFEVYLQWDSLKQKPLEVLRGKDLRQVRLQALERLNQYNISTTLVVTVRKGLNDEELGPIIEHAVKQPCVRGVTFQPVQLAGRTEDVDPAQHRLTLTEVRQKILEQTSLFKPEDILPVPCHPDCVAMAYGVKSDQGVTPLSSFTDPKLLLNEVSNTITFEKDAQLRDKVVTMLSASHSPSSAAGALGDLLCCLPKVEVPEGLGYDRVFRMIIMQFLDPYNFDVRSVKKACIHIAHEDGRIIPFDTYNIFYRDPSVLPASIQRKIT